MKYINSKNWLIRNKNLLYWFWHLKPRLNLSRTVTFFTGYYIFRRSIFVYNSLKAIFVQTCVLVALQFYHEVLYNDFYMRNTFCINFCKMKLLSFWFALHSADQISFNWLSSNVINLLIKNSEWTKFVFLSILNDSVQSVFPYS